ncbi:MAG: hypothetical protein SFW35_04895 [Chitinophagales bacterium]|nr:hypothetical protein [Chitinophagales bacterium]
MKQLTTLMMLCLLVLASCQKEEPLTDNEATYTEFLDNEAINLHANKDDVRRSNLKVVIRQVNNAANTYRLVLKVDSAQLNSVVPTDNPTFQPILGQDNVVNAGLSVPNPNNPDVDQVIFTKEQMVFRRTTENGYFVYVSDPFTTTVKFDYELVSIDYTLKVQSTDQPIEVSAKSKYFILPSGKSVEQAPDIAKIRVSGPGRGGSGASAVFGAIRVTTFDDPIGDVAQVVFKGTLTGTSISDNKAKVIAFTGLLNPVEVSRSIGVNVYANDKCLSYTDEQGTKWTCDEALLNSYSNLRDAQGTIYLLDRNGEPITSKPVPIYTVGVE